MSSGVSRSEFQSGTEVIRCELVADHRCDHETMEHVFKMNMENLGPFKLEERIVGSTEGMRACQQFGRALAERAGA